MVFLLGIVLNLSLANVKLSVAHAQTPPPKLDLQVRLDSITAAGTCDCNAGPGSQTSSIMVAGMPISFRQASPLRDIVRDISRRMYIRMHSINDNKTLRVLKDVYLSLFKADAPLLSGEKYQVGLKIHGHHKITLQATAKF